MTTDPANAIVTAKLEDTRRRLLDLTRRNRLLNHRATGTGTLRIAGEHPDEVFRILVTEGKRMQFLAREEAPAAVAAALPPDEADATTPPETQLALAPIDEPGARADHQTDTRLQTTLDGERLQTRLLHLAREAASALEEQGTNVLYLALGVVEWRETADGDASRAPAVFVPVELSRRSVNSRHTVARFDDEIATNPSLVELAKRQFAIDLPSFDPEGEETITAFLDRLGRAVAGLPGWRVVPEIHLGLFSFAKLLMYRDLDAATWPAGGSIVAHALVRRLSGLDVDDASLDGEIPDPATLDDAVPPEACFQVLDADSSQQAAILAAKRGVSAVVEGPPGTGKSQTIANVIAECLSEGKTVLFVAEKAAALDVVKRRLESVGLGTFVLELHSRKASKRAVLDGLRRSLDADAAARVAPRGDAEALAATRASLNEYVRELHDPVAPLGLSPYAGLARAVALADAPEARCVLPDVLAWTPDRLRTSRDLVDAIDRRLARAGGDLSKHPWRGAGVTAAGLEVELAVRECAERLDAALAGLEDAGRALAAAVGVAAPATLGEATRLAAVAVDLVMLPAVEAEVVCDPRWDAAGPDLERWIEAGVERTRLVCEWTRVFEPRAELESWDAVLSRRRGQIGSFLRYVTPSWYSDGGRLRGAFKPGVEPSDDDTLAALSSLVASARLREALARDEARFAPMFGSVWRGLDGDWTSLGRAAGALTAGRRRVREGAVTEAEIRRALSPEVRGTLAAPLAAASRAGSALRDASAAWLSAVASDEAAWYGAPLEETPLAGARGRLAEAAGVVDRLGEIADVNEALARARSTGAEPFVEWALSGAGVPARGRLAAAFERHFFRLWVDRAIAARPSLAGFRGEEHETLVARFRALDAEWLEASKRRLADRVRATRPDPAAASSRGSKLGVVQAEIKKQRNIMPIRRLFEVAGDVVQAIAPCFMMSPISVAQYLKPGGLTFDVVIFDEASQVEPADAYGAIARGRQLLLVGDEKQLPPTNFFSKLEEESWPGDATGEFAAADLESILAVGTVRLPRRCRLRWHYRSRHASLIEFSNERFYDDAPLRVFPSPHTGRDELGVQFRFVEGGVYRRGAGQDNPVEAAEVVREIVRHAREHPELSLGVGAFGIAQQRAIQDELERMRRAEPDAGLEAFLAAHGDEPFFVKNLETIQGDERDVILLSVGYGPDAAGKITMNFGPLNRDGGWRRLNVLVTRAKRRCAVFSSIRADRMRVEASTPRGVAALKDYLSFAELGLMPTVAPPTGEHDSPFEADVARALRERGWETHAQVGSAGFAIDLAVVDPERPGRYLLGVECDGATYHASATARDRDRLRQAVLEGLGWTIHRVWSSDWFYRREATLARLLERLEAARRDTPPPAPPPAPAPVVSVTVEEIVPAVEAHDDGVEPYRRSAVALGDIERMVGMPPAALAAVIADVVREEGPVHVEEAFRAVAARFATRATKRTTAAFERALATGAVERRGDFLWSPGAEVRVRRRDGDCPVTRSELIAPEELEAAVRLALAREFGLARDAVATATARLLGYARATPGLAAAIDAAIARMLAAGDAREDANGFVVSAPRL